MAAAEASLKENMEGFYEALEQAQKSVLDRVQNLLGKTDEQTAKVEGNTSNIAAGVYCLTENLTSVNEGLEGLSVSDHKLNMAAALASLIEKFEIVNEVHEGPSIPVLKRNMATPEASSTENLPCLMEALEKVKKLLLQRVQNLEEKIDEQREGTKCNTASAVGSLTENLLNEAIERKRAAELATLKERMQSINEAIKESNSKRWSQRVPIFAEKKDEPRVEGLSIEYLRTNLEYAEKANEHFSQWLQNRKGMDELLINQGLPVFDHKRNMDAALARLIEKFKTVNEALEGPSIPDLKRNMATPEAYSTENLPCLKEALEKAKKLLLQRVQNLGGKIYEEREVSSLNEGTKCNTASAVGSLTENLLNEALEESNSKRWSHRIPIFAEKKDEPRVAGLPIQYWGTVLEYAQKADEHFSQWCQSRKGMDELAINQVADMSLRDIFADQMLDSLGYGVY